MSLIDNLKNKVTALKDAAAVTYRTMLVTDEIKDRRLKICNSCDSLFKPTGQCKRCGCFVATKAALSRGACPINKWSSENKNE